MKSSLRVPYALFAVLIISSPLMAHAMIGQPQADDARKQENLIIAQSSSQDLPFLSPGSRGQAVVVLQIALKQLGYYSGLLDGVYENGFLLYNAVRQFQSSNGMPADGVVGPGTWRAIFSKWTSR